jgi:hypothetical protein
VTSHLIAGERLYPAIQILGEIGEKIAAFAWALNWLGFGPSGVFGLEDLILPRL